MKGRKTTGRHFKHSSQATESIKSPFFCPAKNSSIFIVAPKIMTSMNWFSILWKLRQFWPWKNTCQEMFPVFVKICADLGEFWVPLYHWDSKQILGNSKSRSCLKIHCSITEWLSKASHLKASYPPSRLFQEAKNGAAAAFNRRRETSKR